MRIAYATTFNAQEVRHWSGTPFHMADAFAKDGNHIDYIGSLKKQTPPFFKLQQIWQQYIAGKRVSPRFHTYVAQQYSVQVAEQLKRLSADVVISPRVNPIAYLDCPQPTVLWTDAVYSALVGFYDRFNLHSPQTIAHGNAIMTSCLSRCRLAIFSSDWAARGAIELYGADRKKVHVVPFGANITTFPQLDDIKQIIAKRATDKIKLLFLGKSWERKGGDIVIAVAKALHAAGYPVELNIVGYDLPQQDFPPYIHCLGFIAKSTAEGKQRINDLLASSHFLFVPSRAEAFGIVYCEANAFAVPCLTTYVGGISSVVKDHVNGMTFALDASPETYVQYITATLANQRLYQDLALSSYNEFITRLNWQSAVKQVRTLIESVI